MRSVAAGRVRPRGRVIWLVASAAGLLATFAWRGAIAQTYAEEEIKAAYIYHFGTYVDWPESGEGEPDDGAITIAVLGDERVYDQLSRYLPGRTIANRDVRIREILSVDTLGDEEILFIGYEKNRQLDAILSAAQAPGRLIVTDTTLGLRPGAAINFRRADDRVRFEIAQTTAAAANLTLSSRLLASAVSVDGVPNP
jgi:hypothetical protein